MFIKRYEQNKSRVKLSRIPTSKSVITLTKGIQQVPDYFEVIEVPMDFTTIKQKLTDGQYTTDEQIMSDAALVFANCYAYNQDTHIVAK